MTSKLFTRKIESFECGNCKHEVQGNGYTNHCPECLWSKHVDINPGDRLAKCQKLMEPISFEKKKGKLRIKHQCSCGFVRMNKVAESDNKDVLYSLQMP